VSVWEAKVFLPKPLLVRGDGPIMAMRRWYSQFYPRGPATRTIAHDAPTAAGPAPSPAASLEGGSASSGGGGSDGVHAPPTKTGAVIMARRTAETPAAALAAPAPAPTARRHDGSGLVSPACDWMEF
jgi:hypothetical protein